MKQIKLPGSGRRTSQLGFGCAFWPGTTEAEAHRILAAAYDAGVRHFDVAPFYLNGLAEGFLGNFLQGRPDATVTTKYGLLPRSARPLHIQAAIALLGPAVRAARARGGPPGAVSKGAGATAKASFRPDEARRSLERSLRLLKRAEVELFLLHEPDPPDLERSGLLGMLNGEVEAGRAGAFGVGADFGRVLAARQQRPDFCKVMQFDWNATAAQPAFGDAFQIRYWVLSRDIRALATRLAAKASLARAWSDRIGAEVTDPRQLARLMLRAALVANPDGLTLVYSSNPGHILDNVRAASDPELEAPARRLIEIAAELHFAA